MDKAVDRFSLSITFWRTRVRDATSPKNCAGIVFLLYRSNARSIFSTALRISRACFDRRARLCIPKDESSSLASVRM